jgi:uncharacterized protein YprB with RNaseH-like and TPR domain
VKIICISWTWLGEKKTHVASLHEFGVDESILIGILWNLFDQADIIIAHNGDKFDIKKSTAKFIEYNLSPPSTYKTVDTLKVARRYFKFNSNRLNDLGEHLKLGKKVKTGGFDLWLGCMAGKEESWRLMEKYNKQDVILLEKVYLKLRPFMTNHPNMNVYNETTHNCPICSSNKMQKRGYAHTRTTKYQRWQCLKCFGWSQSSLNNIIK